MFMPIFAYFAVVAPVLLGLLCLAEAVMGPPGPMPLATSATGLPVAYVAPKANPILTVREGIVAELPKGSESYALSSTGSVPAKTDVKQPAKTKVAKASSKKKVPQQQQFAQFGWQQNQSFGGGWEQQNRGGWDQQQKRSSRSNASNRNGPGGRYAMSGQQNFFSPFGTIR
jgi:hypothetical protein